MLTGYQARINGNKLQWIDTPPPMENAEVIVMVLPKITKSVETPTLKQDTTPNRVFNFDLVEMEKAVNQPFKEMPDFANEEAFFDWVKTGEIPNKG